MSKITYKDFSKPVSNGKFSDIPRNKFRFRRKARKQAQKAKSSKWNIQFAKLLRECRILAESNKYGYCRINQRYTLKEEVIK